MKLTDEVLEVITRFIIFRMNKINEKAKNDQFSPWQESFNNLLKTMAFSKKKKPFQEGRRTLQHSPQSLKKENSKSLMSRTLLNVSKINLHGSGEQPYVPIQENIRQMESKRYSGPRVTFYAKMNPRGHHKSKSNLKEQEQYSSYFTKKNLNGHHLVRDDSIKYLQIIQEKDAFQDKERKHHTYIIPKPLNLHKVHRSPKNNDQHTYLRRLKMIYNTRQQ